MNKSEVLSESIMALPRKLCRPKVEISGLKSAEENSGFVPFLAGIPETPYLTLCLSQTVTAISKGRSIT
jgi:hypothetical protein